MIVDEVRFRESICRPCNELVQAGYIDVKTPTLFGNLVGQLRFSNYLPEEEVGKHIMRLRQYYDVGFEEAIYYVEDRENYMNFSKDLYEHGIFDENTIKDIRNEYMIARDTSNKK